MSDHDCGCGCTCSEEALPALWNRPGLPALAYRVRTQPQSFANLIAALDTDARTPSSPLAALTARQLDDPTIALADALACVTDVLSFYGERILNEGFLGTASERVSLLDLARQIGYELRPGVAASAYLAFQAESRIPAAAAATSNPASIDVAAGTPVQSLPSGGALPQTFETSTDLTAWIASNQIPARRWSEQKLEATAASVVLSGTGLRLSPGDMLVLAEDPETGAVSARPTVARVLTVDEDLANAWTTVTLEHGSETTKAGAMLAKVTKGDAVEGAGDRMLAQEHLVSPGELEKVIDDSGWSTGVIIDTWARERWGLATEAGAPQPGVFALRQHASMFGHNAQPWLMLPKALQAKPPAGYNDWDKPPGIAVGEESSLKTLGPGARIDLDGRYPKVVPGSWVALTSKGLTNTDAFWIESVQELARADYAMAATVTSLTLQTTKSAYEPNAGRLAEADVYSVRDTAVWAQSEQLALAHVPITRVVKGAVIELEGLVTGIKPGATIILTGEPIEMPGTVASEAASVTGVEYSERGVPLPYTRLTLEAALQNEYTRSSVTVEANVVEATHGMSVSEVLGSSDGTANQTFTLRQKPLTYVTAASADGVASSLAIRVQGVLWEEAPFFYGLGPAARRFIVRRDDDGTVHVLFGDGNQGAIPPPGANTITASYRVGIGALGLVDAGALTLMAKRPPGIATVVNPLAASGAANPESRDEARANAPITVLTLDRAVSLNDYADYARSFAGIAKATASELWRGEERVIAITLAAADRSTVSAETPLGRNLIASIEANHEPDTRVAIVSFEQARFELGVELVIDPAYEGAVVIATVSALLSDAYGFEAARFATAVRVSTIIELVMSVSGVIDADVTTLVSANAGQAGEGTVIDPLYPAGASWSDAQTFALQPAQLLTLTKSGPSVMERS